MHDITLPVHVQVDNTQAQSFAEGTWHCVQSKLRGNFDIREQWVQELRDSKKLVVEYVHTTNNIADLFTKPHSTPRFEQLLAMTQNKVAGKVAENVAMLALLVATAA